MGREVRRVPADWKHPRSDGNEEDVDWAQGRPCFKALYELHEPIEEKQAEYDTEAVEFYQSGQAADNNCSYHDYHGKRPDAEDYMPYWPEEERTHYQMYENTSEGTPISPVCETPEELARWLTDNKASAFASMTASYEEWLSMCKDGFACSMVVAESSDGKQAIMSGVQASAILKNKD